MKKDNIKGIFLSMLSGFCYGLIPLCILTVKNSQGATNSFCLLMRYVVGALAMLPAAIKQGLFTKKPGKGFAGKLLLSSVFSSATAILLYISYDYLPSAIAATLHYLYLVVVTILSIIIYKFKLNGGIAVSLILAGTGIVLMCNGGKLEGSFLLGFLASIISSFTMAGQILYTEHSGANSIGTAIYSFWLTICNALFLFAYNAFTDQLGLVVTLPNILSLVGAGLFSALALFLGVEGIVSAGSVKSSIAYTLEPITCAVGGVLLFHENLSLKAWLGVVLVLAAVILIAITGNKVDTPHG